jgi:hypothetical protein
MTEAEWLSCTDPQKMLEFLRGKASDRKLRLFTVACARLVWEKISWEFMRNAVETAEKYADGWVSREELNSSFMEVWAVVTQGTQGGHEAYRWLHSSEQHIQVYGLCQVTMYTLKGLNNLPVMDNWRQGARLTGQYQPNLLRDLFGNPFRPVCFDPAWLTWKDGIIPKLPRVIYEARKLPTGHLDRDRLSILGDALEDAGCTDPDILDHCRGPGPHVRGCWVVDLILGKG